MALADPSLVLDVGANDFQWWALAPFALGGWIAIAVLQEHDERVYLPVDAGFEAALRHELDRMLASRGYGPLQTNGPCRARHERVDSFVYPPGYQGQWPIFIYRDQQTGLIELTGLERSVDLAPHGDVAHDAAAVATAIVEQIAAS